jgi:hypothetical protein
MNPWLHDRDDAVIRRHCATPTAINPAPMTESRMAQHKKQSKSPTAKNETASAGRRRVLLCVSARTKTSSPVFLLLDVRGVIFFLPFALRACMADDVL